MKKKIKILDLGAHLLDQGTKFRIHGNSETYWITVNSYYQIMHVTNKCIIEVDFSEVPPLYPHKDLDVPKEGIEFVNAGGKLLDIGKNGFTFCTIDRRRDFKHWEDTGYNKRHFELKRQLPPTIEVCAGCFKEVCECKVEIIVGEKYLISGSNMDDDNGLVFCELTVYWVDDTFILCGKKGCWPNVYKLDQVVIKPIQVDPEGEVLVFNVK